MAGLLMLEGSTGMQVMGATQKQQIVIIGAGLAGLAAAQILLQKGHELVVLEARDRIGGRIWTSQRWHDVPLDFGATWIHGVKGNPLTEIAAKIKAKPIATSYDKTIVFANSGQELSASLVAQLESWHARVEKALSDAQKQQRDQSVQQAVEKALSWSKLSAADQRMVNFVLNGSIEQEYAGSTARLSAHWYDDATAFAGDDALFMKGFQQIVEYLAKGVPVALNQIVEQIDWSGKRLHVKTNKAMFSADRVLVTLPLGTLKAGSVKFIPELPKDKKAAIDSLGMGVLNKCYLRFEKAFWPVDVDWLEYIPERRGEWTEWVSFMRTAKLPILLGFNAADRGREIEAWSDKQIIASAMQTLRQIFGKNIPEPADYQITRWASDRFAYGSYSFNALGSSPQMRDHLAANLNAKLFFAGEATERKHFSSAHGAYLSGLRAAQEMIAL